ncbi:MAG: glutamate racemase [Tepidisphaeraceae bacterium]
MSESESPIVVLDSGLGGLTVVRALRTALPSEHILYFGDTARLPYGSKSPATVTSFVGQIIAYFRARRPKHVLIACNTATALALRSVRESFPDLSISGVIEPGAKAAVEAASANKHPCIGIIGTEATIRSRAYELAIHARRQRARLLLRAAPLLVPIIEEGRSESDPLVVLALEQYLRPLLDRAIDVLVLGCTHYPILRGAIEKIVTHRVRVIDSAERCAQDVARRLMDAGVVRAGPSAGTLKCFVTDDSPRFAALASRFLGARVDPPAWISVDELQSISVGPPVRE